MSVLAPAITIAKILARSTRKVGESIGNNVVGKLGTLSKSAVTAVSSLPNRAATANSALANSAARARNSNNNRRGPQTLVIPAAAAAAPKNVYSAGSSLFAVVGLVFSGFFTVIGVFFFFIPIAGVIKRLFKGVSDAFEEKNRDVRERFSRLKWKELTVSWILMMFGWFILSFLMSLFAMVVEWASRIWEQKFSLFVFWALFFITYILESYTQDISLVVTEGSKMAGSVYNYAIVDPINLGLDLYEILNVPLNMASYQSYQWILLFTRIFQSRANPSEQGVPIQPIGQPGVQGVPMDNSATTSDSGIVDMDPIIQSAAGPMGALAYLSNIYFMAEFSIAEIILTNFLDEFIVIVGYIGNFVFKFVCASLNFPCFISEFFDATLGALLRTIFTAIPLFDPDTFNFACTDLGDITCQCGGDLFDFNQGGIFKNRDACSNRRLIECTEEEGNFIESINGVVTHTEYREEHACPHSRDSLDPVRNAYFMGKHEIDRCHELCVLNQNLRICQDMGIGHVLENIGTCSNKMKSKAHRLSNFTIPEVSKKNRRKLRDEKHVNKYTREEAILLAKKYMGSEKFYINNNIECDLTDKRWKSPMHSAYDTGCIFYLMGKDYFADHKHTSKFYHGRKLESITKPLNKIQNYVRMYQSLLDRHQDSHRALRESADYISDNPATINQAHGIKHMLLKHEEINGAKRRKLSQIVTSVCNVDCGETLVCCYNREQCVEADRLEECTDPVQFGVGTWVALKFSEAEVFVRNFDISTLFLVEECYRGWEERPITNPLSRYNLFDGGDCADCVWCLPTTPPIRERFSYVDTNIDEVMSELCPTNETSSDCFCPMFYGSSGGNDDATYYEYGFMPILSLEMIADGFTYLVYLIYLLIPGFYNFINSIWRGISIFIGAPAAVIDVITIDQSREKVLVCLALNMSNFFYFLLALQLFIIFTYGLTKPIFWLVSYVIPIRKKKNNMVIRQRFKNSAVDENGIRTGVFDEKLAV